MGAYNACFCFRLMSPDEILHPNKQEGNHKRIHVFSGKQSKVLCLASPTNQSLLFELPTKTCQIPITYLCRFYQAEFLSEMAYSQLSFLLISFQIRLFNVPLLYPGQRMRQRSHLFRQCYDRFYCLAAKGTETKSPKDKFKIQNCAFSGQTADQHFYDRFLLPHSQGHWDSHQKIS